ncbi:MAG: DnaJ domain-containing protein [Clostridia bacterium]|nr:DnaJ domain-containing protein [Clostridia bacterium]
MKNLYDVLGVSEDATEVEIKSAFRRLAKETHPDINGNNPNLIKKFHEITEAYSVLVNPESRSEYNEALNSKLNYDSSQYETEYDYNVFEAKSVNEQIIREYILMIHKQVMPYKDKASRAMMIGLAWLFGGIFVSYFSYTNAMQNGGQYYVLYGAIFFGGIQAVRGLIAYSQINGAVEQTENEMWKAFHDYFSMHSEPTESKYKQTDRYDSNEQSKAAAEEEEEKENIQEQDTQEQDIQEAKSDYDGGINGILWIFASLVLVIIFAIMYNFGQESSKVQEVPDTAKVIELKTVPTVVNDSSLTLSQQEMDTLIKTIDYSKATRFISSSYRGKDIQRLANIFKGRGYKIKNYDSSNPRELIAVIAHYQMINRLEIDGMAGPNTMNTLAIEIAKESVGNNVNISIKADKYIQKKYGWTAEKVETFTYFVAFEFDYDSDRSNGYYLFGYEVNMVSEKVSEMEGEIYEKYRNLGYLD